MSSQRSRRRVRYAGIILSGAVGILLLATTLPLLARTYSIEELTNEASAHVAPPNVQKFIAGIEKTTFHECITQLRLSETERNVYFSSIPIAIGPTNSQYYLAFPSRHCSAFYGAHAIAYWVLRMDQSGKCVLLTKGASDGLEILDSKSKGMNDLRSIYGHTFVVFRFDGSKYKEALGGNWPDDE